MVQFSFQILNTHSVTAAVCFKCVVVFIVSGRQSALYDGCAVLLEGDSVQVEVEDYCDSVACVVRNVFTDEQALCVEVPISAVEISVRLTPSSARDLPCWENPEREVVCIRVTGATDNSERRFVNFCKPYNDTKRTSKHR